MIMLEFITNLGPLGQFLVGLAETATVVGAFALWLWKWLRWLRRDMMEATTSAMQRMIKDALLHSVSRLDPASYYTLDVHFAGGLTLAVPMIPFQELLVSENIRMAVIDHNATQTTLSLRCKGPGHLPPHHHETTCETEVRSGYVTHLEACRRYGPGETWVIEQGEIHSAFFENCTCFVIHRPPLPTAAVRPVDLDAMEKAFPTT